MNSETAKRLREAFASMSKAQQKRFIEQGYSGHSISPEMWSELRMRIGQQMEAEKIDHAKRMADAFNSLSPEQRKDLLKQIDVNWQRACAQQQSPPMPPTSWRHRVGAISYTLWFLIHVRIPYWFRRLPAKLYRWRLMVTYAVRKVVHMGWKSNNKE